MDKKAMSIIPQANPKLNYQRHANEIEAAVKRVLNSGYYILGKEVNAFETEFSTYCNVAHSIGLGSGTEALHIALRAIDLKPGDQVITVPNTAVATVAAIEQAGGEPVFVDVKEDTYTIDPNRVMSAICGKTKAIIPVHLYGHMVEMDTIMDIARHNNLTVIEDCAQAHGASYKGKKAGCFGDIAAFSFYPTKNLGALGDGGLIATSNDSLADKVRLIHQYGWKERDKSIVPGINSRLDELQAAVLRVKLRYLNEDNKMRRTIAAFYLENLKGLDIMLPMEADGFYHVYHQFVIRIPGHRNDLRAFLFEKKVHTAIHYPIPIHLQPAYTKRIQPVNSLKNAEQLSKQIVSLPLFPGLSLEDAGRVVESILEWFNKK